MSVTDGTSSRLLAGPSTSSEQRVDHGGGRGGAFDRLKGLAALLLRAKDVVVLLDDPADAPTGDDDSASAPSEVLAFAKLLRKRGGAMFVADAASQSWLSDARLLAGLGGACAGVTIKLSDGSDVGSVCVFAPEAREWAADEEQILRGVAAEISARVELRRAERTERARAAEAVGRVELLDTILANSADYLYVFDRNLRYTYASRAGAVAVGRTADAMIGSSLADLGVGDAVRESIEGQIRSVFLTGGSVTGEADVELPVTGLRSFEHVFSPVFGVTGRVEAVVATVRDITGRKAIEHDLKEAKTSAERAAVVKDQFLAALSHELRTPLTPVLATVSALDADESLPAHVRNAVSMIRRNVELQTRLIDDLLDLTRVAKGKIELKIGAVDLHAAAREAAEMCRGDAKAKGVHIELPPEAEPPVYARADGARVRQVLWNLLKNGVKFTPADGEVLITIKPAEGDRVMLHVRDTGVGIPPHLVERIFQPFEQGDPAMARRAGGLGLGLAISKGLVELQGGELSARSAGPSRGSTFTLTLPAASAAEVAAAAPAAASSARAVASREATGVLRGVLRCLIVDDHDDTRYVIRRILSGPGFAVRSVGCVSEALEEAALYDFDLLISDIGLPDGSGLDLMKQLRARYGMKGVALSGYGTEDDVRRSLAAGFHAHLTKPITAEALLSAVAEAAASSPLPQGEG